MANLVLLHFPSWDSSHQRLLGDPGPPPPPGSRPLLLTWRPDALLGFSPPSLCSAECTSLGASPTSQVCEQVCASSTALTVLELMLVHEVRTAKVAAEAARL